MTTSVTRSCWLAALAGLALVLGAGPGCGPESVEDLRAEALRKREAGAEREALKALRQALKAEPDNAQVNLELAELLQEMGRPADAGFFFGEAYRLDPTLSEAALAHAPLLYGSDPEEALRIVEEVLEREPSNSFAYFRRAELELLEPDTSAALASALTAVELAPEESKSHRILGVVYRTMIKEQRFLRRTPEDALFEKAAAAFRRANELEETWYHLRDIATLYGGWPGHEEEARAAWRRAFEVARDQGQGEGAVLQGAIDWAHQHQDPDFLRWALEGQVSIAPDYVRGWTYLAELAEREEAGSGGEVWKRALAELDYEPLLHVGYAAYLGRHGGEKGQEEVVAYLESLPAEVASSPEVDLLLVKALAAQGDLAKARAAAERLRANHPEDPRVDLAMARLDFAEGRLDAAAETLRAISGELDRVDVYRLLAQIELARGNARNALGAASRAVELSDSPGRALFKLLERAQVASADWAGLLRTLRQMQRSGIAPDLQDRMFYIRANYELGREEVGRAALEQLLALEPPPPAAVVAFVRLEGEAQPERARTLAEAAIEKHGPRPTLVRAVAKLALDRNDLEAALAAIEQREDRPAGLRQVRAQILLEMGRHEEAEAELRQALEQNEDLPGLPRLLARALRVQGRTEEAIVALESKRESPGLSARNLWVLGQLYLEQDRLAEARSALEEAIGAEPRLYVAHNDLAYVLAESGEGLDRALSLARQARSALPTSPAVADTLGWVYYRRNMTEPALLEFEAARDLLSDDARPEVVADIHYHLGLVLSQLGREDEARTALDKTLALAPDHVGAKDLRARLAGVGSPGAEG